MKNRIVAAIVGVSAMVVGSGMSRAAALNTPISYATVGSTFTEAFTYNTATASYIPITTVPGLSVYVSGATVNPVDNSGAGGVNYGVAQSTSVIRQNTAYGTGQAVTITSNRLGSVQTDNTIAFGGYSAFGLVLQNNTTEILTSFTIDFDAYAPTLNQTFATIDTLTFSYGFNAVDGSMKDDATTWTAVPSVAVAFGANTFTATTLVASPSAKIEGIQWNPGETLSLRWRDQNVGGADHSMAIDNVTFVAIVPEPGVAGMLGVAGLGLARRRR